MKIAKTATRFLSIMALLLAMIMLFSACGGTDENGSSSGDASSDSSEVSSDETGSDTASNEAVSNTNNASAKNSSKVTSTVTGKKVWAKDIYGTMPASVKKTQLHVLMWRAYTTSEKQMVDAYSKKTGVKIRTTVTTEAQYSTKLVSLISGKDSPDVICFSSGQFPGLVTKALQPLDTATFRLDDSCWNKTYMDAYKVNGKYFGVAMPGIWSCEDCSYVTYYSPKVLSACGVSANEMPWKQYQNKTWNWDSQKAIAQKVTKAGKGYSAISMQSSDLYMLAAGADFASYNGKSFSNNLGSVSANSLLTKAWVEVASLNAAKMTTLWDLANVQQGKIGLFSAISYGLYNNGGWFDNMAGGSAQLEAVPLAGPKGGTAYTPIRPKAWGVPKGAKNPEGAAYFLRYYLDTANCNMSSTFYNKQFEQVYKIITASNAKKCVRVGSGVTDYITAGTYDKICSSLYNATSANITTMLNSKKGTVQTGINRANKDLLRVK